jgi:hypothetical protein
LRIAVASSAARRSARAALSPDHGGFPNRSRRTTIMPDQKRPAYIRPFAEIGIDDIASVGGKNASLGEMFRELSPRGVKVPDGFAVTADAYWEFLEHSRLDRRLREILEGLDTQDTDAHRVHFQRVIDLLDQQGARDILVFGGGTIPEKDIPELESIGVMAIFTPGTPADVILTTVAGPFSRRSASHNAEACLT